jgi:hypothetical protein
MITLHIGIVVEWNPVKLKSAPKRSKITKFGAPSKELIPPRGQ